MFHMLKLVLAMLRVAQLLRYSTSLLHVPQKQVTLRLRKWRNLPEITQKRLMVEEILLHLSLRLKAVSVIFLSVTRLSLRSMATPLGVMDVLLLSAEVLGGPMIDSAETEFELRCKKSIKATCL